MVLLKCFKVLIIGFSTIPMAFGALSTGVLFGNLIVATSRNPDEGEKLYGNALTAFALIETFSFLAIVVTVVTGLTF